MEEERTTFPTRLTRSQKRRASNVKTCENALSPEISSPRKSPRIALSRRSPEIGSGDNRSPLAPGHTPRGTGRRHRSPYATMASDGMTKVSPSNRAAGHTVRSRISPRVNISRIASPVKKFPRATRTSQLKETPSTSGGCSLTSLPPSPPNNAGLMSQSPWQPPVSEQMGSTNADHQVNNPLPDDMACETSSPVPLPGRSHQVQLVCNLLKCSPGGACPPCVYLYGPRSTGKSLTITTVLSHLKLPSAMVHGRECYSREIFFTDVINQLTGDLPTKLNQYFGRGRCDNLALFVDRLSRLLQDTQHTPHSASCVIVVEEVDSLYCRDPVLVQGLLTVPQLVGRGVVLVFTSHQSLELLLVGGALAIGIVETVFFPPYSKAEVLEILLLDCPADVERPFYQLFLRYVWNVLQVMCNDLGELKDLSRLLFLKYMEPVQRGEVDSSETHKLWRRMEPYIKTVLQGASLQTNSTTTTDKDSRGIPDTPGRGPDTPGRGPDTPGRGPDTPSGRGPDTPSGRGPDTPSGRGPDTPSGRGPDTPSGRGPGTPAIVPDTPGKVPDSPGKVPASIPGGSELPLSSRYLLLASFLASNNPANTDKQFFSNLKMKHRKRRKSTVQQLSRLVSGPGVFGLDRVLAILHCIQDCPVISEGQLLCQLSTLASVHYIAHVNREESLDLPRYRCRLSLDDALRVASTVGFDLLHHLYQPDL